IVPLEPNEQLVTAIGIDQFNEEQLIITASSNGNVKLSKLADFQVQRYNRTFKAMNIKKEDTLVDAKLVSGREELILFTEQAYALRFPLSELSVTGVRTAGVRGMNVRDGDRLVSVEPITDDSQTVVIATQRGAIKRMNAREIETTARALRGISVLKEL